jgi:hypothetical protein
VVDLAMITIHQCGILDSVCRKIVLKEAFEIIRPSQSVITTIFFLENGQKGDSAKSENFKVLAGG